MFLIIDRSAQTLKPINPFCYYNVCVITCEHLITRCCFILQITRVRNKWRFILKDGIMNLKGKDYVFQKSTGEGEWQKALDFCLVNTEEHLVSIPTSTHNLLKRLAQEVWGREPQQKVCLFVCFLPHRSSSVQGCACSIWQEDDVPFRVAYR